MKILLLLLLSIACYGQKTFIKDGKLNGVLPVDESGSPHYQIVRSVEGISKEELYKRARKWFVKTYFTPKDVLQLSDPSTGELTGNGNFDVATMIGRLHYEASINHTLSVDLKDGRYRIVLDNITIGNNREKVQRYELPYILTTKGHYTNLYSAIDQGSNSLLQSLERALATTDDF